MADTQRSRSAILSLFADNVTGQISAQDLRDFVVTIMNEEFANTGDFWAEPQAKYHETDQTAYGWILYSQAVVVDVNWHDILYMDPSTGCWSHAHRSELSRNGLIGLAMDTYTSDTTTCQILLQGIIRNTTISTYFSRKIGDPVYLASITSAGSYALDSPAHASISYVIGFIMPESTASDSTSRTWYFAPGRWGVTGN